MRSPLLKRFAAQVRRVESPRDLQGLARIGLSFALRPLRRRRVRASIRHVFGPAAPALGRDQMIVLCPVRNARAYVGAFLDHYLRLGAAHVVLLDNGSEDDTLEIARGSERVTVLRSDLFYGTYMFAFRDYLLERFGRGRWALLVDVDEFLDYPFSDRVPLATLLGYLNRHRYTAVVGQMLDLFGGEPLRPGSAPLRQLRRAAYRYYDLCDLRRSAYAQEYPANEISNPAIAAYRGGIRRTLFGLDVELTKHPLVLGDGSVVFGETAHRVHGARLADFSCVLYHYKLVEGFHETVEDALRTGRHWNRSHDYRLYGAVTRRSPALVLKRNTAEELSGTSDLLERNFLVASARFRDLAQRATR